VLQSVSDAGVLAPITVRTAGHHPAIVTVLLPSRGPDVLGWIEGRASRNHDAFGAGPVGVAALLGRGERARFLSGYPLVDGRFMELTVPTTSDQDLELRTTSGHRHSLRPFHVRLVPADGAEPVPAIVQIEQDAGTTHGILAAVGVGPALDRDRRSGSGRWLFGLFDDGSPMIWERLPAQSLEPEWATRTLTATPDGTIYLMAAQPDGVSVYRRPRRA
jgi:hypothetical protein